MVTNTDLLKIIKEELLKGNELPLYDYRIANHYLPVIGEGNHEAKLFCVGEAPGETEAKTGRPFCGRAGKVLDELFGSIGLDRSKVYITNLIKDRPPANRDPLPHEIEAYGPYLTRQLEIIKPRVVATLGRYSMRFMLEYAGIGEPELSQSIGKLHGQVLVGRAPYGELTVIALYHPAAAIYNQALKPTLISDFAKIKPYVD